MNLRNRLENVTERAVLFQIFKDLLSDPENQDDVIETLCDAMDTFSKFLTDKEYATVLTPILDTQCPIKSIIGFAKGVSKVSAIENMTTFRDVMTVLSWLKHVVEKSLPDAVCESLKVKEADAKSLLLFRDFSKACSNLPDKISNCSAKAQTEEHMKYISTVKWIFKMNLLQGIQKALLLAHFKTNSNLNTVAELISAGRNMDLTRHRTLLEKLIAWIGNQEDFDARWAQMMRKVFQEPTILGTQVHESLLTSVFLAAQNDHVLMRCIHTDTLSGTLRRVVMVKLPFQRVLKTRQVRILVNFVHRASERLGIELFETALKIWADVNFPRKSPEPEERHIVRIIAYSIYLFRQNPVSSAKIAWSDLFLLSMNGVHSRMGMVPVYVQSALFINSTLNDIATEDLEDVEDKPEKAEIPESQWTDELKRILEKGLDGRRRRKKKDSEAVTEEDVEQFIETEGERPGVAPIDADSDDELAFMPERDPSRRGSLASLASGVSLESGPRAPFGAHGDVGQRRRAQHASEASDEEEREEEDSTTTNAQRLQRLNLSEGPSTSQNPPVDSDDDEDFPTYQIDPAETKFAPLAPGEEPKQRVPPPAYIGDAYDQLLEKEHYEVFESAFFNIKSLIDRRAIGFPQLAERLFVRIIHLPNTFGTKNFEAIVDGIAISCIVQRPEIVPALVRLLIAPGQSSMIQRRLLHYIHKAADEMGAIDRRNEAFVVKTENRMGGVMMDLTEYEGETPLQAELRALIAPPEELPAWRAEVEARIAANTRRIGTTRTRPRAGVVNQLARAAKYMFYPLLVVPRGEHARLLGKDSDILAYIIMVASMVYVRCGVNPAVSKMTTELLSYVTPHRFSENAKLRTACLAAYLNVMALLPGNILADLYPPEVRQEWLHWAEAVMTNQQTQELEYSMAHQIRQHLCQHLNEHSPAAFMAPHFADF